MDTVNQGPEMEGAMMQSEEAIKKLYEALIAQGLSPEEAIEKVKQITNTLLTLKKTFEQKFNFLFHYNQLS